MQQFIQDTFAAKEDCLAAGIFSYMQNFVRAACEHDLLG
jgi:hypothetical protein